MSIPIIEKEKNLNYSVGIDMEYIDRQITYNDSISIDYSNLKSDLKLSINDCVVFSQTEINLQNKIDDLKKELARLNAPNMKCFDRLI